MSSETSNALTVVMLAILEMLLEMLREVRVVVERELLDELLGKARQVRRPERVPGLPEREAEDVRLECVIRVVGRVGREARVTQAPEQQVHVPQARSAEVGGEQHQGGRPGVTAERVVRRDRAVPDRLVPGAGRRRRVDLP